MKIPGTRPTVLPTPLPKTEPGVVKESTLEAGRIPGKVLEGFDKAGLAFQELEALKKSTASLNTGAVSCIPRLPPSTSQG